MPGIYNEHVPAKYEKHPYKTIERLSFVQLPQAWDLRAPFELQFLGLSFGWAEF